jgi:hypothetical protein
MWSVYDSCIHYAFQSTRRAMLKALGLENHGAKVGATERALLLLPPPHRSTTIERSEQKAPSKVKAIRAVFFFDSGLCCACDVNKIVIDCMFH